MKNQLLIPLIILTVVGLGFGATTSSILIVRQKKLVDLDTNFSDLTSDFEQLMDNYETLFGENEDLQEEYDDLLSDYNQLQNNYNNLQNNYNQLLALYNTLNAELTSMVDLVKELPLLDKMTFYYHCCRMNFNPYIDSRLEFARDLILHGDYQYNGFTEIDSILNPYDFWEFGSSMADTRQTYYKCLGSWMLDIEHFLYYEEDIFDWVTSNIDYRYDDETAYNRDYPIDLYLSPLETLKYRAGDCDDYAILGGMLFEDNYYDVYFSTIHDSVYYPGGLHHAFLWVEVGEARINSKLPLLNPNVKWSIGGGDYDWLIVDLTSGWQETIWKKPGWLKWYYDNGYSSSDWLPFVDMIECDPPS